MNRGRKKRSADALSTISWKATVKTLQEIARDADWSAADICEQLQCFVDLYQFDELDRLGFLEDHFRPDQKTIRAALEETRQTNDGLAKAIHFWISTTYPKEFEGNVSHVKLARSEPFASSLKGALGHGRDLNPDRARSLVGKYKFYQPYHSQPDDFVMVGLMTIGGPGRSDFDCSIRFEFSDGNRERSTPGVGKIVPHGPRATAVLRVDQAKASNLICYFDKIDRGNDRAGIETTFWLAGILIAGVGGERASGWPCFADRLVKDEEFSPSVLSRQDLFNESDLVREHLDRGAISWR